MGKREDEEKRRQEQERTWGEIKRGERREEEEGGDGKEDQRREEEGGRRVERRGGKERRKKQREMEGSRYQHFQLLVVLLTSFFEAEGLPVGGTRGGNLITRLQLLNLHMQRKTWLLRTTWSQVVVCALYQREHGGVRAILTSVSMGL